MTMPGPTQLDPTARHTAGGPVVVAVDRSASAREATRWAARLAAVLDTQLVLVHVVNRPGGRSNTVPEFLRHLGELAAREGARIAVEVLYGNLSDQLGLRAREARLLVLGSYGEGAWSGALAGINALAMTARGPAPLVVVRGSRPGSPPPSGGPIVVGVDGTEAGEHALTFAAALAAADGHDLVLVHTVSDVVDDLEGRPHRIAVPFDELLAHGARLLDAAADRVRQARPSVTVRTGVVADRPLTALLAYDEQAWLIVVGHRRRPGGAGMMLGSTSHALVEFARCPVAVLPPEPAPAVADRHPRTGHVADVMTSRVLTTTPRTRAVDAALTIALHDIGALPVLDGSALVGMFTEEALTAVPGAREQRDCTVGSVMTSDPVTVGPDTPLTVAAELMHERGAHSIPVLRDGELVGIVTARDLPVTLRPGSDQRR